MFPQIFHKQTDAEMEEMPKRLSLLAIGRSFVFLGLLALAGQRAYSAFDSSSADLGGSSSSDSATPPERRLQVTTPPPAPSPAPTCQGDAPAWPIKGVRYIPHLVGEPYPHPESKPWGYYTETYASMHKRDLPVIGQYVQANTLSLRPWPTDGSDDQHAKFFEEMHNAGVCQVIPSFHVSKFYADMLLEGILQPRTDPSSAFAVDFQRFGASVHADLLGGVSMAAWTIDLSLDLKELLPLVGSDCMFSKLTEDKSFQKYIKLLDAIERWVRPAGDNAGVAPALASAPFLVPLDVSRVPWTEPQVQRKLNIFLKCMSTSYMDGGWSSIFEGQEGGAPRARWLLSFAGPLEKAAYDFRSQLSNVSQAILEHPSGNGDRAVVMFGTQALKTGGRNPINSVNLLEDYDIKTTRYTSPYDDYEAVSAQTQNLDGFIYDEWMDDWDRGTRGPFFLAAKDIEEMKDRCGSRFAHDDTCSRTVGNSGQIYPEYFGLAGASSQLMRHCVIPRFGLTLFGEGGFVVGKQCAFMTPSLPWLLAAGAMLVGVAVLQVAKLLMKWCCRDKAKEDRKQDRADAGANAPQEEKTPQLGYITVVPTLKALQGEHTIELQSTELKSGHECGWWLCQHTATQMATLEKQVSMEVAAIRALRSRRLHQPTADGKLRRTDSGQEAAEDESEAPATGEETDSESMADADLSKAMQVIHRRTLEGFATWCNYVASATIRSLCRKGLDLNALRDMSAQVTENSTRPPDRLFAEALVLRVMESIGEQMLQCPERLSFLLFHTYQEAGGLWDLGPTNFTIDMDKLHDGLVQMNLHTNPYTRCKMPNGKWELGLNFDDINESGIQCREKVTKTFKEPASMMVVIDFILCYRVPIMLKLYCLALSAYIYLGSHQGDDITTTHNGTLLAPKWLRINFLQYLAFLDAAAWTLIEATLIVYVAWQRWPSLGYRSPGIPGLRFMLTHALNLSVSALGGLWVFAERNLQRKPWECAESDVGDVCEDPRVERLLDVLKVTLMYWACRAVIFILMNGKVEPIFLYGTPDREVRKDSGRGCYANMVRDLRVNVAWIVMLGTCVLAEVYILLPTIKGLDWSTTCGLDLFGDITGLPASTGVCSVSDQGTSFQCLTCLSSVSTAWLIVLISAMVDIYFVFYIASAVVGGIMGSHRHLNDLKNTSMPIDLREHQGREAALFERAFGPGWQHVWRVMVRSLHAESLVSPKQAESLAQAAGVTLDDGEAPMTQRARAKNQKPIHLTRFPALAAERLAFFFQSLKSIEEQSLVKSPKSFEPSTDALTGVNFDPGSIPSLTQIIPAYNEVVIPSVEFLRSGAEPEDAKNGSPDDQPGLGDLTLPPAGDGVNTNLAFMISQFPDEWVFLTKRLHAEGWIESAESQDLYHDFMKQRLNQDVIVEVRMWAAMRMQSVAKTVIGALQYGRALASLPKIKQWYAQYPEKRVAEDHVEVILAHQTYGHVEGSEKNDEAVQLLLEKYADDALYLVFDLKKGSSQELWKMAENFFMEKGGYSGGGFQQASVKCKWDKAIRGLRVLEILPRKFQLRLGQGDYKTQGKACNQLNGLRFATGHYVQALDCNMGTFIGEGFKVPYVLRMFMPLDKNDRTNPKCRYLGFREYIYTGREGTVGQCHAAAEWTFGTINQRFLSGMGTRMHYGHPDFLDGFWARNRGGMSKSSPVVNLSEDIFAGYNVRMREEASPHIDFLEFEKGREATFNAASNFFSKISGGSISVIRSRDNHLLCERVGILHSLSFYFASVSFYVSNLLVDVSVYLYVILFILFSLAGIGPGQLSALGSCFSTEWIVSMGLVTLVPQLAEIILEVGAVQAFRQVFGGLFAATFFFIFQNKNIASSMKEGAMTGIARYFFTGRPPANQHQTWRDIYNTYWKSHYKPAFFLATAYVIYCVLAVQNGNGKLPMALVVISFTAWVVTPILFSPFPRWNLIGQDLREFNSFITGGAGSAESEIDEVVSRGKKGTVRSLYECGLADELCVWSETHPVMLALRFVVKVAVGFCVLAVLPAEILDFLPLFVVVLGLSWVVIFGYFAAGLNNVFLVLSFLVWFTAIPIGHLVIGGRWCHPNAFTRLPEYVISFAVFLYFLGLAKEFVLLFCRTVFMACPCANKKKGLKRLQECIRMCFVYFFVHQLHTVEAWVVLVANLAVSVVMAAVDQCFCNVHTWFLLNRELARTKHGERYMEKSATFFELDRHRFDGSDLYWSDSDSEVSAENVSVSVADRRSLA